VNTAAGDELQEARAALRFREVAALFKLIEQGPTAPLVIAFRSEGRPHGAAWLPNNDMACDAVAQIERHGISRALLRRIQRFTVSVPKRLLDRAHGVRRVADAIAVLENVSAYDERFGVLLEKLGTFDPETLIV
jgi:CRISPR-associated endonuclease/helicase Cas3